MFLQTNFTEWRCGMFLHKDHTINVFRESIKTKTEKNIGNWHI